MAADWLPVLVAADRLPVLVAADRSPVLVAADWLPVAFSFDSAFSKINFTPAEITPGNPISAPTSNFAQATLLSPLCLLVLPLPTTAQKRLSAGA